MAQRKTGLNIQCIKDIILLKSQLKHKSSLRKLLKTFKIRIFKILNTSKYTLMKDTTKHLVMMVKIILLLRIVVNSKNMDILIAHMVRIGWRLKGKKNVRTNQQVILNHYLGILEAQISILIKNDLRISFVNSLLLKVR